MQHTAIFCNIHDPQKHIFADVGLWSENTS